MALREDELKIFIGSLNHDINKPQLLTLFQSIGLEPVDVIVPPWRPGKMAFAFAIFNSTEECVQAIQALQGATDHAYAPGAMMAHRGDRDPSGESLSAVIGKLFLAFV